MSRTLLVLFAATLAAPALAQPAVVSDPESRQSVSLTVYNGGFAVVREVRPLRLPAGRAIVRYEGVPAQIDPTSLALVSLTDADGFTIREQNYQYDLVGTQTVLDRAVGQRVRLRRPAGDGRWEELDGILISQPGQGRIIRLDDGRVLVDPSGEIELAEVPAGLVSRPTLVWALDVARAGEHRTEASYLTNGISWKADYVAVLREDDQTVDVTGWVTLDNQSGATFHEAALQLMAGEVRRVSDAPQMMYDGMMRQEAMAAAPAFQEEAFFEYHLYTLDGTTTLQNRETKQMTLMQAAGVGVRRRLVFDGAGTYFPWWGQRRRQGRPGAGAATDEQAAAVVIEFENTSSNNMGMPLPAGKVRVYQADRRGNLQFLGEDRIGHTPRDERVRLYVGDAFDVVGTRRLVDERRISDREHEQTIEIEVRNRKETSAEVAVVERTGFYNWRVTQQSHPFTELDVRTIEFALNLAAGETQTVRYTVRTRW